MERNIIISIVLGLILLGSSLGLTHLKSQEPLSDLEMANIEALTETELPGVTITCDWSPKGGKCYKQGYQLKMCGEWMFYECIFTGYQKDTCNNPC